MKVVVVGLGSMGRRRIRLIRNIDRNIDIFGIDFSESRRKQAEEELNICTSMTINEVVEGNMIDAAFICTSPLSHPDLITQCLENNMHVFTEINLHTTGYDYNLNIAKKREKVLFLSSTLLYRREIQYIRDAVKGCKRQVTYQYHVGQYLPNWHPWENYKDFFVGKKETNGCREFMAIDFPWIISVFGNVTNCSVIRRKISSLDLPYCDSYQIMFEHNNAVGQIIVDVVSRKAVRNLEISGEELFLTWDGSPCGLYKFNIDNEKNENIILYDRTEKRTEYNNTIIEDAYAEEIKTFFNVISKSETPKYTFEEDYETIRLIDLIEGGI